MNIVPSAFSETAWNYFLYAKKIAYQSSHQNIDSEHIFLSILHNCLLYTSPSPRDRVRSRMPSSA